MTRSVSISVFIAPVNFRAKDEPLSVPDGHVAAEGSVHYMLTQVLSRFLRVVIYRTVIIENPGGLKKWETVNALAVHIMVQALDHIVFDGREPAADLMRLLKGELVTGIIDEAEGLTCKVPCLSYPKIL